MGLSSSLSPLNGVTTSAMSSVSVGICGGTGELRAELSGVVVNGVPVVVVKKSYVSDSDSFTEILVGSMKDGKMMLAGEALLVNGLFFVTKRPEVSRACFPNVWYASVSV